MAWNWGGLSFWSCLVALNKWNQGRMKMQGTEYVDWTDGWIVAKVQKFECPSVWAGRYASGILAGARLQYVNLGVEPQTARLNCQDVVAGKENST